MHLAHSLDTPLMQSTRRTRIEVVQGVRAPQADSLSTYWRSRCDARNSHQLCIGPITPACMTVSRHSLESLQQAHKRGERELCSRRHHSAAAIDKPVCILYELKMNSISVQVLHETVPSHPLLTLIEACRIMQIIFAGHTASVSLLQRRAVSSGKRLICWFSSPAQPRWEGCFADNRISNFFQINRIIIDYYYSCGATGRPSKHISKIGMPQFRNPQPINLKLGTRDHVVSFTLHAKIHSGRPSGGIPVDRWVAF